VCSLGLGGVPNEPVQKLREGPVLYTACQVVNFFDLLAGFVQVLLSKKKQLEKDEKRIAELDRLFIRLYEDNVASRYQ